MEGTGGDEWMSDLRGGRARRGVGERAIAGSIAGRPIRWIARIEATFRVASGSARGNTHRACMPLS